MDRKRFLRGHGHYEAGSLDRVLFNHSEFDHEVLSSPVTLTIVVLIARRKIVKVDFLLMLDEVCPRHGSKGFSASVTTPSVATGYRTRREQQLRYLNVS